ncbi:MAG: Mu transposase C-terminal domain-containing protein [Desulfuromusa sp.]|nr:Mu transposase C-terminal domain-containing protein [Desulfuromusa sp.]
MSRQWYSISELKGLPGLPGTTDGIRAKAKRENWQSRKRHGNGGGYEYHIDSLPAETKAALLDQAIESLPETSGQLTLKENHALVLNDNLPAPASLPAWRRNTMDARLQILALVDQLAEQFGISKAIDKIVARAQAGTLPEHIQQIVPLANARSKNGSGKQTLSRRTLYRWRDLRDIGTTALAPAEPAKQPIPAWVPYFLKCYQKPQKPSIPDALEELEYLLPEMLSMPSPSQARRFLDKMSKVDREKGRMSAKEIKTIKPFRSRDTSDLAPLEVCMCDGHSFKASVRHPIHGRPFKPEVCAVIDAATRVVTGWSAGLAESAQTVADALRHGIMVNEDKPRGGIPLIFYTDPGSGNKAKVNADPVFGRYARLGITFKTGIVGNSQARGLVERLQRSLWIRAAKKLPTYSGKDMDASVQYKTQRLLTNDIKAAAVLISWPQFLDLCQQAVDDYNNRPHSALPKITDQGGNRRYMTPNEMWDAYLAKGWVPDTATELELDDLFRPRVQVTTRRGNVRLFGNTYFNSELQHHFGEQVFVEYEPQNGQFVYVRDMDERLICKAGFEANRSRMFPVSESEHAMEKRATGRAKRLYSQLDEVEAERRGVVEIEEIVPAQISQFHQQLIDEEKAETNSSPAFKEPDSPASRIQAYRQLMQQKKTGNPPCEEAENWLKTFMNTNAGKTMADLDADIQPQGGAPCHP